MEQREPLAEEDHPLVHAVLLVEPVRRDLAISDTEFSLLAGVAFTASGAERQLGATLGDRIALLRDGRILQTGTPRDLYEKPQTPFAASFIGMTRNPSIAASSAWRCR